MFNLCRPQRLFLTSSPWTVVLMGVSKVSKWLGMLYTVVKAYPVNCLPIDIAQRDTNSPWFDTYVCVMVRSRDCSRLFSKLMASDDVPVCSHRS